MSVFEVIDARPYHCGRMARHLRATHAEEVIAMGFDIHRELRMRYLDSWFRRAWMIDGDLVGLGGVAGTMFSGTGMIWLALTPKAATHPLRTAKEARRQLAEIMEIKRELWTYLLPGDEASIRFARLMGFEDHGIDGVWKFNRVRGV